VRVVSGHIFFDAECCSERLQEPAAAVAKCVVVVAEGARKPRPEAVAAVLAADPPGAARRRRGALSGGAPPQQACHLHDPRSILRAVRRCDWLCAWARTCKNDMSCV
jgi:hypothetical protein